MGQAKKRGTFEERLEKALNRNAAIVEDATKEGKNPNFVRFLKRYGPQAVSNRLIMAGLAKHT